MAPYKFGEIRLTDWYRGACSGNGTVEFEEFLAMMTRRLTATSTDDAEAKRRRHDAELRQACDYNHTLTR